MLVLIQPDLECVFALLNIFTIGIYGRRALLLFDTPNIEELAAVSLFVYFFAAFYSPDEGSLPTRGYINYQIDTALPYCFKRTFVP